MIVDIYTHILPKALIEELGRSGGRFGLVKRLMEVTTLHDLDARFRQMDEVEGDYRQIVSLPNPPVEAFATREQAPQIARIANDAMAELGLGGVYDRHPDLKIVTHHCGGMVPFFDARIEKGLAVLGSRTKEEDYSGLLAGLKRPHIDYFRMFYADTALFGGSSGVRCG